MIHSYDVPAGLPILSGGGHDQPSEGACFMEYVGLLAGEKWGDNPECVADALVTTMQGLNDTLTDQNRQYLAPLLTRTIGLGAEPRWVTIAQWQRYKSLTMSERSAENERYIGQNNALSKLAFNLFAKRMRVDATGIERLNDRWAGEENNWFSETLGLAEEKAQKKHGLGTAWQSSPERGQLFYEWAEKLHECFEEAMQELGMERNVEQVCSIPSVIELMGKALEDSKSSSEAIA